MIDPVSTHHLIDPQLLPALDFFPALTLTPETLPLIREGMAQMSAAAQPKITPVEKVIQGPDGMIDVLWFDPSPGEKDRPCLQYIHGGGMILGTARAMADWPAELALSLNMPVASVDYRLAPETPFPGPQEDCFAALCWLSDHCDDLGIDPTRIGVTGESAGGGLAAAVAQMSRDRQGPKLAAQILVYPMLDHRVGGPDDPWCNRYTGEFVWTRASNQFGWEALRGDYAPNDANKGWFSPSLADDLSDLPPTWIGVGGLDLFFDEDLDYARRLVAAGVPVELQTYPGAFHGFNMASDAAVVQHFLQGHRAAILRLLGAGNKRA